MKTKKNWIVICLLILLAVGLYGLWLADIELIKRVLPGFQSRSSSMELVEVNWTGDNGGHLRLRIPRAYLTGIYKEEGEKGVSSFTIETGLPDLQPRPAVTTIRAEVGTSEWKRHEQFIRDG